MIENQSKEQKRASNIIWNASGDYSFQPDFVVYDSRGKANLYWNYIIGAVRKYYDYPLLQQFFSYLKVDPNHIFYESLTWIGLENCAYQKGRKDRPVLDDLRQSYAQSVLRKEDTASFYYLVDEVKRAHFQRALGEEPVMREQVLNLLNDLEFDGSMNTEQIILRMNEIIDQYFQLSPALKRRKFFNNIFPRNKRLSLRENAALSTSNPFRDAPILSLFNAGSTDASEQNLLEKQKKKHPAWRDLKDQWEKKQRERIQNHYGMSILPESQTKALEKILCVENHRTCHLHFTRGEFDAGRLVKTSPPDDIKMAMNQRAKNKAYYKENLARNSNSIEKLTSVIRNAMLLTLEAARFGAKSGNLVAGKVWRNLYLHDDKVFQKKVIDETGNLSVDILLDGSGSQIDRQEMIATECFIIAESLTRCRIPVKVYSFCASKNFTIINLFRDYGEVDKNEMIFHYHSSGCNRDGLAIRTALHTMADSPSEYKILIVLSDGKPLDPEGIPGSGFNPDQYIYADAAGVTDTAMEVRKGWRSGTPILCVYTGAEDDLPAAKKMYGNNLVCIKTPERFADVVGIMIKNVLKNL